MAEMEIPGPFSNYQAYELVDNTLYLAPDLAKNATQVERPSDNGYTIPTITFPLASTTLSITYDPGPSDDPTFVIQFKEGIEYLGGEKLYISANGDFYLVRRSGESFEKKLKFRISGETLQEVVQPYYLVDQEYKTTAPLFIYDNKCNTGNLVTRLPIGTSVKILLAEINDHGCESAIFSGSSIHTPVNNFLISTPFGLIGWVASSIGDMDHPGKPLGCIRFQGD